MVCNLCSRHGLDRYLSIFFSRCCLLFCSTFSPDFGRADALGVILSNFVDHSLQLLKWWGSHLIVLVFLDILGFLLQLQHGGLPPFGLVFLN